MRIPSKMSVWSFQLLLDQQLTLFFDVFRSLAYVKTCCRLLINHLRLLEINPQAKITSCVITIEMEIPTGKHFSMAYESMHNRPIDLQHD